jgi:glycosyltransferase involved in cell wall biosynthesis
VPTVSVVIRAHNSRTRLPRAIASVQRQTATDWELIIVDDGSGDGTVEWIHTTCAGQPRMRLIAGSGRRGAAAAANAGIERARGRLIALLDSDDAWEPDFLARMRQALDDNPSAIGAYADQLHVWEAIALERVARAPNPDDQRQAFLLAPPITCLSQALFRREALVELGPLDTRLALASDRDLLLRAALRLERPFVHVPLALARRHFHDGNLMNGIGRGIREGRTVIERAFEHPAAAPYAALRERALTAAHRRVQAYAEQRQALRSIPDRPISVVIVTRGQRDQLAEAIASVDRQDYPNRELIVVDNGSTDGTVEWLASLERGDLRLLQSSGSTATARNLGLNAAEGEIVASLNDTDRWQPDYLTVVAKAFSFDPVFTYTDFTAGGSEIRHDQPVPRSASILAARRDVLRAVGGYNEALAETAEADLYQRLLTHQLRPPVEAQVSHPPAHIARPMASVDASAGPANSMSQTSEDRP